MPTLTVAVDLMPVDHDVPFVDWLTHYYIDDREVTKEEAVAFADECLKPLREQVGDDRREFEAVVPLELWDGCSHRVTLNHNS